MNYKKFFDMLIEETYTNIFKEKSKNCNYAIQHNRFNKI